MAQVDLIRNGIIDKLLSISDKDYLIALRKLVDNAGVKEGKIKLTKEGLTVTSNTTPILDPNGFYLKTVTLQ